MEVKDLLKLARFDARHEQIIYRRMDKDEKLAKSPLYRFRTRYGLTIEELAQACRMSPTTVRKIEKGRIENISTGSLIKLARFFRLKTWKPLVKGLDVTPGYYEDKEKYG